MGLKRPDTRRILCKPWIERQDLLSLAPQRERIEGSGDRVIDPDAGARRGIDHRQCDPTAQSEQLADRVAGGWGNVVSRSMASVPMMLQPKQVWLAIEPVDMRLGIDGLSLVVQGALGIAPCGGSAYGFRNKRSNRIKLLLRGGRGPWDRTGVWLGARRLHRGQRLKSKVIGQ